MDNYDRLSCWSACHELAIAVFRATERWPSSERYALTSQVRRAAFSAAANIAEGAARRGAREFRRFLDIALGSLAEVSYALLLARDVGILADSDWRRLDHLRGVASRQTWGLYRRLSSRLNGDREGATRE